MLAFRSTAAVHPERKEPVCGGLERLLPRLLAAGELLEADHSVLQRDFEQCTALLLDSGCTLSQGDTTNLLGCLLADNQLPTQVYTAMYFIVVDMCATPRTQCAVSTLPCIASLETQLRSIGCAGS